MRDRTYSVVTAERLREVLAYDPPTGEWRWLVKTGARAKVGELAGGLNGEGYRTISIDGIAYRACRLAWLYMKGEWPKHEIDHDNRNRSDDRWENLKEKTSADQKHNTRRRVDNSSGYRGVSFHKPSGKYRARVNANGREYCGRYWDTAAEAAAERDQMREELGVRPVVDENYEPLSDGQSPTRLLTELATEKRAIWCMCCRVLCRCEDGEHLGLVVDVNPATGAPENLVCRNCKRIIDLVRKSPELIHSLGMAEVYLMRLADKPAPPAAEVISLPRKESA